MTGKAVDGETQGSPPTNLWLIAAIKNDVHFVFFRRQKKEIDTFLIVKDEAYLIFDVQELEVTEEDLPFSLSDNPISYKEWYLIELLMED